MKLPNRSKLILVLLVLGLAMLSCTEVFVKNNAALPVRVSIYMPGWQSPETRKLDPGENYMFQGEESGSYYVNAILDEDYVRMFTDMRNKMSALLTENRDDMTSTQLQAKVKELEQLNNMVNNIDKVYCHGLVDDESTPTVEINYNQQNSTWSVRCE